MSKEVTMIMETFKTALLKVPTLLKVQKEWDKKIEDYFEDRGYFSARKHSERELTQDQIYDLLKECVIEAYNEVLTKLSQDDKKFKLDLYELISNSIFPPDVEAEMIKDDNFVDWIADQFESYVIQKLNRINFAKTVDDATDYLFAEVLD